MLFMLVTFDVLKLLTSRLVKLLQLENMPFMFFTFLVFRYSMPTMLVSSNILSNHLLVLIGRALANDWSNTTVVTYS